MKNFSIHLTEKKYLIVISFICALLLSVSVITLNCLSWNKQKASAATIDDLMTQVSQYEQLYVTALINKNEAELKVTECQKTIDEATEKIPIYQQELLDSYKLMYINNIGCESIFSCFLKSNDLNELINNIEYFNRINRKTNELMQECTNLKEQAQKAQDEIWPAIVEADSQSKEAENIIAGLKGTIAELEAADIHIPLPDMQDNYEDSDSEWNEEWTPIPGPAPTPAPTPTPAADGNIIVERALSCIGLPYGWAKAGPDYFDCSGLVSYAYTGRYFHYWSTYTIRDPWGNGLNGWYRTDNPSNGTVCCSNEHCGIYYNGQMIHSPDFNKYICIGSIQNDMLFYNR